MAGAEHHPTIAEVVDLVRHALESGRGDDVVAALDAADPSALEALLHVRIGTRVDQVPLTVGIGASPGAAAGVVSLTNADALTTAAQGGHPILFRHRARPADLAGMRGAAGIVTTTGGLGDHTAVLARGWATPAVVGADEVRLTDDGVRIAGTVLRVGDEITIDGSSGAIFAGSVELTSFDTAPEVDTLLGWADAVNRGRVEVRANADSPLDAARGIELGANGIGLCRTEFLFLAPDRLDTLRRYAFADDPDERTAIVDSLEAGLIDDIEAMLDACHGRPVTIRLLDAPLHEYFPTTTDLAETAKRLVPDHAVERVVRAVRALAETNPMLGTRGVRLGAVWPGLHEVQVRAICAAAGRVFDRGRVPHAEILVPMVVDADELRIARGWVDAALGRLDRTELAGTVVTVGAMVETPRAALRAGDLAAAADFLSFGTNDLTQMVFGFSRDDVGATVIPDYRRAGVLRADPFATIDRDGVGTFVTLGIDRARVADPELSVAVCGEHAADPDSIEFFVRAGVDRLSCSPMRVPVARLAAARALLRSGRVTAADVDLDAAN